MCVDSQQLFSNWISKWVYPSPAHINRMHPIARWGVNQFYQQIIKYLMRNEMIVFHSNLHFGYINWIRCHAKTRIVILQFPLCCSPWQAWISPHFQPNSSRTSSAKCGFRYRQPSLIWMSCVTDSTENSARSFIQRVTRKRSHPNFTRFWLESGRLREGIHSPGKEAFIFSI